MGLQPINPGVSWRLWGLGPKPPTRLGQPHLVWLQANPDGPGPKGEGRSPPARDGSSKAPQDLEV